MLFHASSIGRTDVVQNAIGALRSSGASEEELLSLISMGRPEDDATPLHLAAAAGHSDVIRYLLVWYMKQIYNLIELSMSCLFVRYL